MVNRVVLAPAIIGRQSQQREGAAKRIIRGFGFEEGAVPAVMLQDKQPDKKSSRRQREQQDDPVTVLKTDPHQDPQEEEREERGEHLSETPAKLRLPFSRQQGPVLSRPARA